MTYFGFLARFLLIPLLIISGWLWLEKRRGKKLPTVFQTWPISWVILGHVVIAIIYTTPWDNYLVATSVWWYDPNLVTGYTIGWVPIEEYTFFVLQTILTGMWVAWLMIKLPAHLIRRSKFRPRPQAKWGLTGTVVLGWVISTILLLFGPLSANYLTLILSWALLPIILQFAFGADILWYYGRLLLWGVVPPTLYLAVADTLAIQAGTWTISEEQTLGVKLGGILPIEEFTFFLVTNTLVVFGIVLVMAVQSHDRVNTFPPILQRFLRSKKSASSTL